MARAVLAAPARTEPRRARSRLHAHLDRLLHTYGAADIESDPIRWVHQFADPADQELTGLLASTLAYGAVPIIQGSVGDALARLDHRPARTLAAATPHELRERFAGFRHRFHDGIDMALLLNAVRQVCAESGSIGGAFKRYYEANGGNLREALAHTIDLLRSADPGGIADMESRSRHAGIWHSLSDPRRGSACKRWNLYLRWMVRPNDGVDFGLWTGVDPAHLIVPLDTHVGRISRLIGLTARATPDWIMAEQITAALREFDPRDPVKYDFALSRLGILKVCRSRRDASLCPTCPLDPVCCL